MSMKKQDPLHMKTYEGESWHFDEIKKINSKEGTIDRIVIAVDDFERTVCRSLIMSVIPYFKCMLTSFKEKDCKIVPLEKVDVEGIKPILEFVESGKLEITVGNVMSIYAVANYFIMEELKCFCEDFIVDNHRKFNVFELRHLGGKFCSQKFLNRVDEIIYKQFDEVATRGDFLYIEKEEFLKLISRSDLEVRSEKVVYETVIRWVNYDLDVRSPFITELMKQIQFCYLDKSYFTCLIKNYPAFSLKCEQQLGDASGYYCNLGQVDNGIVRPVERGFPEGKIYYFHNYDSNIYKYENKEKQRTGRFDCHSYVVVDNFVIDKCCPAYTVLKRKLYTTGGYNADEITDSVEVYSLDDKTSTFAAKMNCKRSNHGSCVHNDRVYVCGGKDGNYLKCCEVLEDGGKEWRFVASMNEARSCFPLVSCGKYVWALGGIVVTNVDKAIMPSKSIETYDTAKDVWKASVEMLEHRVGHAAVSFRKKIYIFGNLTAELFDTTVLQSTAIVMTLFIWYFDAVAISGKKIYIFGGPCNRTGGTSVCSYNVKSNEWMKERSVSAGIIHSALTVFED